MKGFPYDKKTFSKEFFTIEMTLDELLPGLPDTDELNLIGPFDLTFYFMKRAYGSDEKEKFFYRHFESSERSTWLKKFGGIKLFRDNFRIRPYGEIGTASFDWLGLGERAAKSPAGVAKKVGGWKVGSNQVAGVIKISRVTNVRFEDKSSREGLQENRSFEIFRKVILGLIDIFETDRHVVMRSMSELYTEKNKDQEIKEEALNIAADNQSEKKSSSGQSSEKDKLSQAVLVINQENENLKEEFRMLRSLASAGLIVTSFSHELKSLSSLLKVRNDQFRKMLEKLIKKSDLKKLKDYEDPFLMLKDMSEQDTKLQNWIQFSINSISRDRRRRVDIDFAQYFKNFQNTWSKTLGYRQIKMALPKLSEGKNVIRAFPIDLDSIFSNLLVNSLDAFKRQENISNDREVSIGLSATKKHFEVTYEDNGPGLDKNITNPYKILEPFFTTKVDRSGNETGTGLGMWIVKNTVDDYKGEIEIIKKRPGFKIKIFFPVGK
jgi:signal transduction histidine kinase